MRWLGRLLLLVLPFTAGAVAAGTWWYTASAVHRLPILLQTADGNLVLADESGQTHPLTNDADGRNLLYLFATPSPDGRSVAVVAIRNPTTDPAAALVVLNLNGTRKVLFEHEDVSPFYLAWSPDSRKIAFLANTRDSVTLFGVSATGTDPAIPISPGQPLYFSWSPDSGHVLLHTDGADEGAIQLYEWGALQPQPLEVEPAFFQAPAWLNDGQRAVVAVQQAGESTLATIDTKGNVLQQVVGVDDGAVFTLSPDSQHIAYLTLIGADFSELRVTRTDGTDDRGVHGSETYTFFWSPDGKRLAFLSPASAIRSTRATNQQAGALRWNVLSLQDGNIRSFEPFVPSNSFVSLLPFFDQYAQSVRLWDSSSTHLLFASMEGVYTLDVESGEEQRIGDGVLAFWMR
jgi:TolB protein